MNKQYKVYFLLSYTGSWLAKLIKIATKMEYTHVAMATDSEFNQLYSFGRKTPTNPVIGGFVREQIKDGVYDRFPNTVCSIYELEVTEEEHKNIVEELNDFKEKGDKYGYDFLGLIGMYFNYEFDRENHYFCSQFVATVLKKSGIDLFNKPVKHVTPQDFAKCKALKCLYTGELHNSEAQMVFETLARAM